MLKQSLVAPKKFVISSSPSYSPSPAWSHEGARGGALGIEVFCPSFRSDSSPGSPTGTHHCVPADGFSSGSVFVSV